MEREEEDGTTGALLLRNGVDGANALVDAMDASRLATMVMEFFMVR